VTKRQTPPTLRTALGRAIRQRRVAMGVSQAEIGARCRVTKGTLAHIECGMKAPSLGMLHELAWALDVKLSVLFAEAEAGV
jgi:HTH-type transcriptional regulator/antitoxin HipB